MITSRENPQVKNIKKLIKKASERKKQGLFLIEGIRMFEEMPPDWRSSTYVSESFLKKDEHIQKLSGAAYEIVSDAVFAHMSDTQTPQGILCAARQPQYQLQDLIRGERTHLLILEEIQDPGNLGTMFRTAEGAGATGIVLGPACADLFSPKTVRSTMGSIYRVPFYAAQDAGDFEETLREIKRRPVRLYAAHLNGTGYYDAFDYRTGCAFLIGNEAAGLKEETAAYADICLRIPMEGCVESLNAAMAAGILMYEANRQRRYAAQTKDRRKSIAYLV